MLKKISNANLRYVFYAGLLVLAWLAYSFSFKQTFRAIALNRQLKQEHERVPGMAGVYPQLVRKNAFYEEIVKSYKVKKEERESRLWQSVSDIAISKSVKISYNTMETIEPDTNALKKGIVSQQFIFKGSYGQIVKLLDSLSKAPGIGRISEARITKKKDDDGSAAKEPVSAYVTLSAIEY